MRGTQISRYEITKTQEEEKKKNRFTEELSGAVYSYYPITRVSGAKLKQVGKQARQKRDRVRQRDNLDNKSLQTTTTHLRFYQIIFFCVFFHNLLQQHKKRTDAWSLASTPNLLPLQSYKSLLQHQKKSVHYGGLIELPIFTY